MNEEFDSPVSSRPPDRPSGPGKPPGTPTPTSRPGPRWLPLVMLGVVVAIFLFTTVRTDTPARANLTYSEFTKAVDKGTVKSVSYDPSNGKITGEFTSAQDGKKEFTSSGPNNDLQPAQLKSLAKQGVDVKYTRESSNPLVGILLWVLPLVLIIGFFIWMNRRAQGQMGAVMNIGRSRAKVYDAEKPKTTFSDVAGYGPVKQEITEVVDFLKNPGKFKEIGARIPRGVLLVGPPGTGKTLLARAVAGEAGVPFVAITGSDFMEMFVGVGAARVRDLFATARKQAPAIIFIDEIDSIGRKRGAGLGGGHDEREQTLNQMLAEMDGFETSVGIVMIAATNRPDILDSALLRPGRFDRQIMVPLPTQEERVDILKVHFRDKKIADDVDIAVVARGTPGMSGADLANLVNEAALFAVRRGETSVHREDFEDARDRVLMGLKRPTVVMNEEEKEHTAFHEGGHAVAAYVLEHADPVHKVTILPTGMALGMTQQLPEEEKYSHDKDFLDDMLSVLLGGRVAEQLVFGSQSTGAQNDLVRGTEIARRMVREWGMSDRIGPMAWGSQGAVFLGEDLVHTRDYSDETARVIDEEVERILRSQEERTLEMLTRYRPGLEAVARALLEHETLDGLEVERLVDDAMGYRAGGPRKVVLADGTVETVDDEGEAIDEDGHPVQAI
ncbi:MAG: ATP-dependent zinc metalloprotease FtsH [Acidimicrobiia bacterium]